MADNATLRQAQPVRAAGRNRPHLHELNNLLGIVIGNLDLLNERPDLDAETKELAGACLEAALRGVELLRQLSGRTLAPQEAADSASISTSTRTGTGD